MPQDFPTAPKVPRPVRTGAVLIALLIAALGIRTTMTSLEWIGRVFPGFCVLDNRVIASVGLPGWPGFAVPDLFQSEIVAVDGVPVASKEDVYDRVARLPIETPVRYRLRKAGAVREVTIPTARFSARDWVLLFGMFLLNGIAFAGAGLVVWTLRSQAAVARAVLVFTGAWAVFILTAMDLYGPATFFRLHAGAEALVAAGLFQFTLLFPTPHRYARWRFAGWAISVPALILYETFLYQPPLYSALLQFNMLHLGAAGVTLGARLVTDYWRSDSRLARVRIRIVMVGAVIGLALPGMLGVLTGVGEQVAINVGVVLPPVFMLSLAYAVLKHDVFEIDSMMKRGAYYLAVTGAVGGAYAAAIALLDRVLRGGAISDSAAFPLLFALAVLLLFNPLRTRLQAVVDRVFFRTGYDGAKALAAAGEELAAALSREDIARVVGRCIDATVPNGATRLFAGDGTAALGEVGGDTTLAPALAARLATGRLCTAFDPVEAYPDASTHATVRAALTGLGIELAVPLLLRGELVGVLAVGPKRSGLFYTAGDAEYLRALAHETAIALQNAASYEALAALNAELESRVRERTAQLAQSEKLASLGRLVAGVAHEMNNPMSFVAGSIGPLRERLAEVAARVPPDALPPMREAEELVDLMARGADRTVAIVKDLRSFSRLGEEARKPADLHEGLEVTLRLLGTRWQDRITVHRDYGPLPPVTCNPGQVNQVFMNLLANACDAIDGAGNIWISTSVVGDGVRITIRDDGCGMAPAVVEHVFEPFFTTKDVGGGTGLGLSISHGVVTAHDGTITVESTPGRGTAFHVHLPLRATTLDTVASRNR